MSKFKDKEAFTRYNEEKKRDTFTVSVNADEMDVFGDSVNLKRELNSEEMKLTKGSTLDVKE